MVKRIAVFVMLILVAASSTAAALDLTEAQRLADFDALYAFAAANYPFFAVKERITGQSWFETAAELRPDAAAAESPRQFYRVIFRLVSALDNGHSNVVPPERVVAGFERYQEHRVFGDLFTEVVLRSNQWWVDQLPAHRAASYTTRYAAGHYYVTWVHPSVRGQLPVGFRITAVNGVPVHAHVQRSLHRGAVRWDAVRQRWYVRNLPYAETPSTELTGVFDEQWQRVVVPTVLEPAEPEEPVANLQTLMLDEDVAYVRIRSFNVQHVTEDAPLLRNFLVEAAAASHLIVDIRGNGGGTTAYWRRHLVGPLIERPLFVTQYLAVRQTDYARWYARRQLGPGFDLLAVGRQNHPHWSRMYPELFTEAFGEPRIFPSWAWPREPVGFQGQIILLVDDDVFSAAENLAVFAKETGWALIAGTTTGGDGIGMDPVYSVLPHSGLVVRMPIFLGANSSGVVNEQQPTQPDLPLDYQPEDFSADFDRALGSVDSMLQAVMEAIANDTLPNAVGRSPSLLQWLGQLGALYADHDRYGLPRKLPSDEPWLPEPWPVLEIRVLGLDGADAAVLHRLVQQFLGPMATAADLLRLQQQLQSFWSYQHVSVSGRPTAEGIGIVVQVLPGNPVLLWPPRTAAIWADALSQGRLRLDYANALGPLRNVTVRWGMTTPKHHSMAVTYAGRTASWNHLELGWLPATTSHQAQRWLQWQQRRYWRPDLQIGVDTRWLQQKGEVTARWQNIVTVGAAAHWQRGGSSAELLAGVAYPAQFERVFPQAFGRLEQRWSIADRGFLRASAASAWMPAEAPAVLHWRLEPPLFRERHTTAASYLQGYFELRQYLSSLWFAGIHGQWTRSSADLRTLAGGAAELGIATPIGLEVSLRYGRQLGGDESLWRLGTSVRF